MKRCVAFLLAIWLLVLCGCCAMPAVEHDIPVCPDDTSVKVLPDQSPENVFLADYDALWETLEENYPFFPVLEANGIDVSGVRQTYRSYAENTQTIEQFMDILDRMFAQLRCFAHLSLIHRDRYDLLMHSIDLRDPEQFEPWRQVLEAPATIQTYSELPVEQAESNPDAPAVVCEYYPEIDAAYFRISKMDLHGAERDRDVVTDYLAQLPPVAHVIFDVTGNPGGSTRYWEQVLLQPFGGSWQAEVRLYYQDTPQNHQYYGGQLLPVEQEPLPGFAVELDAKYYQDAEWNYDFGTASLGNGSDAKRWVLIDGQGYSATEHFAAFCKLTGWATLVGERTAGDGLGGQPLLLAMEHTGLLVHFSTAMVENPDGSLNAAQGVLPDHVCLPKMDMTPLELCLELIASE